MKVILKNDLKGTGKAGQLVNVSDGYAKNYLIPRGIAVEADSNAMNVLKGKEQAEKHRLEVEKQNAKEAADALKDKTVKIFSKAGAGGRLFGSVTSKEIAAAIKEQLNIEIDRRKIIMQDDIKTYGSVQVEAKLHPGITTQFYVVVGSPD